MLGQVRPFTLVFYLCDQCPWAEGTGARDSGPERLIQFAEVMETKCIPWGL